MRRELMEELEADTTLEDIAEPYRLVVEMIGLKLSLIHISEPTRH